MKAKNVISEDTPLAMMTIGQLLRVLRVDSEAVMKEKKEEKTYVYGLKGIQNLFHVSHTTAQIYKDGIIKDACYQSGRKIVVDVEKAMELFNANRNSK